MQSGRWLQNLEKPALSNIKVYSDKADFSETLFVTYQKKSYNSENSNLVLIFNKKQGFYS